MYDEFIETVWSHYKDDHRGMPWRKNTKPYWVFVSEMMLQQTQANRVIPKFNAFVEVFPTIETLAAAPLGDVIRMWSGLGYNRRAKYLHDSAKLIVEDHESRIPNDTSALLELPGIGTGTAGAIRAYAFNEPVVYIETNIRAVYLYHFFTDETNVDDSSLLPLIEATLDTIRPREWYWALMDYGSEIKRTIGNTAKGSKHHSSQSTFEGSDRQVRGAILRELTIGPASIRSLETVVGDKRVSYMISKLAEEGLIELSGTEVRLP